MDPSSPPPIDPSQVPDNTTRWPKTLGVITIVIGALGSLGAISAPIMLPITRGTMKNLESQGADGNKIDAYLSELSSLSFLSSGVMLVLGIILLVGGILLLKRKPVASLLLQVWAVLKILGGGYVTFRNSSLTKLQMEIMSEAQGMDGEAAAMFNSITSVATSAGLIFGLLWLLALPVFLLIWFNRAKIKTEIGSW